VAKDSDKPPFKIRHGLIVWMDDCPPLDGLHEKRRPLIVVEPDVINDVTGQPATVVVACSSTAGPKEYDAVELPNLSNQPQTTTGLPRACWAIPRWILFVSHATLYRCERSGTLGGRKLQEVLANYVLRRSQKK
jgi:mRNA-degrading endonuclease toxin of MazEF toxin-antitoxin module